MAEEEIGGVVTAHAGTSSQEKLLILTVLVNECRYFLGDVAVISLMASATRGRRNAPIGPGLAVYAIDRIKTKNPLLNEMADGIDHSKVFKIVKSPGLGREDHHRLAGVAVDLELHILAEVVTPGAVIFDVHGFCNIHSAAADSSSRSGERSR